MKKIIMSSFVILAVAAIAGYATISYFSDTETSTGNTFTAGAIDLKMDSHTFYNGNECVGGVWVGQATYPKPGDPCGLTWGQPDGKDIVGEKFFDFADIKPGDTGENTISLHVVNNDAWACAKITITSDEDVDCTEPENVAEGQGVCVPSTTNAFNGEIAENLSLAWWADDGDNNLEENETSTLFFLSGAKLKDLDQDGDHILNLTLADINTNFFLGLNNVGNTTPITGDVTKYIGLAWCFGNMSINGTVITCDGEPVNNESQSDKLTADMEFSVVQSRNNPGFECPDSFRTPIAP
jgi:predicted ribosomally synthesized peptide with SipW-like signal peptide